MPTEEAAAAACLADVVQSTDRVRRRNALRTLEKSIVPKLDAPSVLSLLRDSAIVSETGAGSDISNHSLPGLGRVLLSVVGDDGTSEICREKAAVVLRACLSRAFGGGDDAKLPSKAYPAEDGYPEYLGRFYADFCPVLHGRLAPRSPIGDDGGGLVGKAPPSSRGPAEPSEEIRLVLVETASDVLSYMFSAGRGEAERNGEEGMLRHGNEGDTGSSNLMRASSALCCALASTGLADPYPELKRACCGVLIQLSTLFPGAVREQAVPLLRPITGGAEAYGATAGSAGIGAVMATEASLRATKSSSGCMVRHRHAKTRCLALEATAAIIACCHCCDGSGGETKARDDNGSGVAKNGNVLQEHVLPCWEDFPPFDRSAAVRLALVKAVGVVAKGVAEEFVALQGTEQPNLKEGPFTSPARMLVLLLMGMSDEADNVCQAASDALAQLAAAVFGLQQKGVGRPKTQDALDATGMIAAFVSARSVSVLLVLLRAISGNSSLERKVRGMQALELLIRLVNRSVDDAEHRAKGSSSATDDADSAEYPLQHWIVEISLALCSFFGEDEASARNSAASCGRALGTDGHSASSVLALLLPSIRGESVGEEANVGIKKNGDEMLKERLIVSSIRQHAAALTLLCCLAEGACTDRRLAVKGASSSVQSNENTWLSSYLEQVSGTISNTRVLEAVAQDQSSAWALLEVCLSLVKYAELFCFNASQSKATAEGKAGADLSIKGPQNPKAWSPRVVVDVLSCCFQLLGCPSEFGLTDQALELLDSIPGCQGQLEKEALLRLHFRNVLERLLSDDNEGGGKIGTAPVSFVAWAADDRRLHAFEALLRNSGGMAVGENFDLVAPVLECHLADGAAFEATSSCKNVTPMDYTVKLSVMALVESIVSDPLFPKDLLHPFTAKLLDAVIMPNLVWRVGGKAASLRKVSAAALFSLLRCGGATAQGLFQPAPRLLPVLKSNLGDDDASTRELVISSLAIIFELLPRALGEDAVHQLYPDLIKCLDDSSDNVRFAACGALRFFFKAAEPRHFSGTAIEYMVDQLLIHMDDPDRRFQSAVVGVLTVALDVDGRVVMKKTKEAQSSHRSGELCSLLLRRAEEKIAAERVMRDQGV